MEEEKLTKNSSTRRQVGITLIVISGVLLLLAVFNILGDVRAFLLGFFGLMIYPVLLFTLLFGVALSLNLRFIYSYKYVLSVMLSFFFFVCVLHSIFTSLGEYNMTYGQYLMSCYNALYTPGGMFISLFTFPLMSLLHDMASIIIYAIALVISIYFVMSYLEVARTKTVQNKPIKKYEDFSFDEGDFFEPTEVEVEPEKDNKQIPTIEKTDEIIIKDPKEIDIAKKKLGLKKQDATDVEEIEQDETPRSKLFGENVKNDAWTSRGMSSNKPQKFAMYEEEIKQPKHDAVWEENKKYLDTIRDKNNINDNPIINAENYDDYKEKMKLYEQKHRHTLSRDDESFKGNDHKISEPDDDIASDNFQNNNEFDPGEFDIERDYIKPSEFQPKISPLNPANFTSIKPQENASERFVSEVKDLETPDETLIDGAQNQRKFNFNILGGGGSQNQYIVPDFHYDSSYVPPSVELLKTYQNEEDYETDHEKNIESLERVLDEFKIPAKVENVCRGAAVTRYELRMPVGIPVKKIQAHSSDIALALAAKSDIRIEAPIKGKSAVGIEVPNNKVDIVGLKDIICSKNFVEAKSPLTFALGKDVDGNVYVCNLAKMPHLLVAGSTGSGKSVCLNALILSLIYRTSPEDLRLILVDPKRVEFAIYNDLPHLLMPKVITEPKKALSAFDWLINEMERRFLVFQSCFVKSINEYNNQSDVISKKKPKLPFIVLVVDELADLVVTTNKKDLEEKIIRLTQKARAAGIHLILATQRPSVDIITGSIKINLPTRVAFAVTNFVDSKTILDQGGAEKLLGRGDMLYAPNDGEPVRVQGCFVDTPEVRAVVDYIKQQNPVSFDDKVEKIINSENSSGGFEGGVGMTANSASIDSIFHEALKHVIEMGQVSTSMLQRRFGLGFPRAAKIIDQMQQAGFISASDGTKPRAVYMTMEDFNKYYGTN